MKNTKYFITAGILLFVLVVYLRANTMCPNPSLKGSKGSIWPDSNHYLPLLPGIK